MSGNKDFRENEKGLESPADIHELILAGGTAAYTTATAPRCICANTSGTAVITDFEDTTITYNVIVGQQIPLRIKAISAGTAELIAWW